MSWVSRRRLRIFLGVPIALVIVVSAVLMWERHLRTGRWSAPGDSGVQCRISLSKRSYEVGEPIIVTFDIRNTGKADVKTHEEGEQATVTFEIEYARQSYVQMLGTVEHTGHLDGYGFIVAPQGGRPLREASHWWSERYYWNSVAGKIRPRQTFSRDLVLNFFVPVLEPGAYEVAGTWHRLFYGEKTSFVTPPVKLWVADAPPARLRERIADLGQRLGQCMTVKSDKARDMWVKKRTRFAENLPRRIRPDYDTDEWRQFFESRWRVERFRERADGETLACMLGFTGEVAAIPHLVKAQQFGDYGAQWAAARALMYIEQPGAVKVALMKSLKEQGPAPHMVEPLLHRLGAEPDEIIPLLLPYLTSKEDRRRLAAVDGLRMCLGKAARPEDLYPHFRAMLKDPSARVRQHAAAAVGWYNGKDAFEAMKATLADGDDGVREVAVLGIGYRGTPEAVDVLLKVLSEEQGEIARQAIRWLRVIGDERAIEPLKKIAQGSADSRLQEEAKDALGELLKKQQGGAGKEPEQQ